MKRASRIVAAAAAAGAVSFTYQQIAEASDRRRFPPPGRMVDIGGRCLHLVTEGAGSPTVVIIPALADNVLAWLPVLEGVAPETQACVYDRAEVGWSDPPPRGRRTLDLMAEDLHVLLPAADIAPPYVLVGHSIGGLVARRFYAAHPGLIAGILLIDSSHEQQARRIAKADWPQGPALHISRVARRLATPLGARRLAASLGLPPGINADIAREVAPEYVDAARAIMLSTRFRRVFTREALMMTRTWGHPPRLGSIPLTVLSAGTGMGRLQPEWGRMQNELAALSTDGRHITAPKASHYIHLDAPDLVIQEIRDLVRRCR